MLYRCILVTFLGVISVHTSAQAEPKNSDCQHTETYQGEPLYSDFNGERLPSSFNFSGNLEPELTTQLNEAVNWTLQNTNTPGITAAVGIRDRGIWSTTNGLASTQPPTKANDDSVFWWASVGKMFTASIILQMVAENQLSLDQTIDNWFSDYPQAQSITIRDLLTHTGGVFSFQQDREFRRRIGYSTPEELIALSAQQGADFCPGMYWYYSNTGYVILARIIEAIAHQPFAEVVDNRLIQPLGLTQTYALDFQALPPQLARGHIEGKPDPKFKPSLPFGAGNVVASAEDMVVFLAALLSGEVYPRSALQESLSTLYPMFDDGTYYGQGIMLYDLDREGDSVQWLGHSGGSPSVRAVVAYDLERDIFVAVAMNGNVPAEALAYRLVEIVESYRESNGD